MSADSAQCPVCGAVLPKDRLAGLCPACTWKGLGAIDADADSMESPSADEPATMLKLPGHDVMEEIARGGMGIVYRARQLDPSRTVALKMLLPHQLGSPEMAERFRLEVRALTELEHPAILPVHQMGEHDGLPFFTMKLATGGTLTQRKAQLAGNWRAIAELMATLADAVQFAHERGVLHRDLKPGNILFDDQDRPYVSDFGLAKLVSDDSDLTRSVDFLGTPNYVAPEVAVRSARHATTASDIYSLGAIFYELLTGHPPFEAESVVALLKKIVEEEPTRPSELRSSRRKEALISKAKVDQSLLTSAATNISRDLEVICLKCLSKEPSRRYASAREFADDLRRWLAGKPISARPTTPAERFAKWVKRNPVTFTLSLLLVLALAGGGIGLARSNVKLEKALADSRSSLSESLLAQARFQRGTGRVGQRFQTIDLLSSAARVLSAAQDSEARLADLRTEVAGALALPDLRIVARWPVFVAHYETEIAFTSDLERYVTAVADGGFTIFTTTDRRAVRHFAGSTNNPAVQFRFSPDNQWVAASYQDGHAEIYSLMSNGPPRQWPGQTVARSFVAFSPDSRAAVISIPGKGAIWHDLPAGTERPFLAQENHVDEIAFEPSSERLAISIGRRCELWRGPDFKKLWSQTLAYRVSELAWSRDGSHLGVSYDGREQQSKANPQFGVWLLNATNGVIEATFTEHERQAERLAFHPAHDSFVSVAWDDRLIWRTIESSGFRVLGNGSTLAVRFSPDGRRLAFSPTHDELALAEISPPATFRAWRSTGATEENVFSSSLSPDGAVLATAAGNGIHLWDTATGEETSIQPLPAKAWWVMTFFHPDGQSLFYSGASFGVMQAELKKVFDTQTRRLKFELGTPKRISPGPSYMVLGFAPDRRSLVIAENRRQTQNERVPPRIWLWPDGDPARAKVLAENFPLVGYRLVAGGKWGVTTDNLAPDLWLWNPETGARVRSLGIALNVTSESSADGRWLITRTRDEDVLWDTASWIPKSRWPAEPNQSGGTGAAFSRDSRFFANADLSGQVILRSVPDGKRIATLPPPEPMRLRELTFSAAGDRIYLLRLDGRVYEWDLAELNRQLASLHLAW
jgi:serine/threonine protein kinase/WD40 repeat protein